MRIRTCCCTCTVRIGRSRSYKSARNANCRFISEPIYRLKSKVKQTVSIGHVACKRYHVCNTATAKKFFYSWPKRGARAPHPPGSATGWCTPVHSYYCTEFYQRFSCMVELCLAIAKKGLQLYSRKGNNVQDSCLL